MAESSVAATYLSFHGLATVSINRLYHRKVLECATRACQPSGALARAVAPKAARECRSPGRKRAPSLITGQVRLGQVKKIKYYLCFCALPFLCGLRARDASPSRDTISAHSRNSRTRLSRGSLQGFPRPFKAIQGYPNLFKGFWKKKIVYFFWKHRLCRLVVPIRGNSDLFQPPPPLAPCFLLPLAASKRSEDGSSSSNWAAFPIPYCPKANRLDG
jgi:hypothetical protein